MKILAFSDTHATADSIKKVAELEKKTNPDLLICAGDISLFGTDLNKVLKSMSKINKPILLIPGNHETVEEIETAAAAYENIVPIHNGLLEVDGVFFLGHGTGGFSERDREFERLANSLVKKARGSVVLVTHAPPYGTKLDKILKRHVGSKSYREFIDKNKPAIAISGHIHENFGISEKIGSTIVINPGPYGAILEIN